MLKPLSASNVFTMIAKAASINLQAARGSRFKAKPSLWRID